MSDTKQQHEAYSLSRWTPSLPTNLMTFLTSYTNTDSSKPSQPSSGRVTDVSDQKHEGHESSPQLHGPPSPTKDGVSVMFEEPETRTNSEDASRDGSFADDPERRQARRNGRARTRFSLCHPPPASSTLQRLHRRPRSMMQLHRLSDSSRPKPAYEVIPSANFSVRLTKAITKVFKTKHSLCANDMVILKAEKYAEHELDDEQEARDIVALICKGRKEDGAASSKSRICLPDGQEWEASCTSTGGYEFSSTDEHGLLLTVRWVPKKNKNASRSTESRTKFNFSTISPNSRKHPVIGCLSKTTLDVNDTYKLPEPAAVTPLSTPKLSQGGSIGNPDEDANEPRHCETDERLREVIVLTGICVSFKEGWSPLYKSDERLKDCTLSQSAINLQSSPSKQGFQSPAPTPPDSPQAALLEKRSSIRSMGSSIMRNSALLSKGNRGSMSSAAETEGPQAHYGTASGKTGRARGDSTSTVLVHRAASNRTRNSQAMRRSGTISEQQQPLENSVDHVKSVSQPTEVVQKTSVPSVSGSLPAETTHQQAPPPFKRTGESSIDATPKAERRKKSDDAASAFTEAPTSSEKRGSNTTTNTNTTSASRSQRRPSTTSRASRKKFRRKGGWLRLLCGGSTDV